MELCFDILDDLSDEFEVSDYFVFVMINELSSVLRYGIIRRVEYYFWTLDQPNYYQNPKSCRYDTCPGKPILICDHVAQSGDLDVLKWLYRNGHTGRHPISYAICRGHLDILKWSHDNHIIKEVEGWMKSRWIRHACHNGHIDIMKWLCDKYLSEKDDHYRISSCMGIACEMGHLDIVEWLNIDKKIWIPSFGSDRKLHVDVVYWMISNGHCKAEYAIEWARKFERVDVIEFLCLNMPEEVAEFIMGPPSGRILSNEEGPESSSSGRSDE